jgi:5-methylcytosine-specific restriction endonuclease McrA
MSQKQKIPKALREQVWILKVGPRFETKCKIVWCTNRMNVFDYQCGHNVPESKGGEMTVDNLIPICGRCNVSMGNHYTIDAWNTKFASHTGWRRIFRCGC